MLRAPLALIAALSLTAAAVTTTATTALAAPTDSGKLTVTAVFVPDPPSTKGKDKITITVKNAAGTPVRGATVKIATSMPTMSMKGADIVAKDHGDGTYTANADFAYATTWAFEISADAKGQHGTMHIQKELK